MHIYVVSVFVGSVASQGLGQRWAPRDIIARGAVFSWLMCLYFKYFRYFKSAYVVLVFVSSLPFAT